MCPRGRAHRLPLYDNPVDGISQKIGESHGRHYDAEEIRGFGPIRDQERADQPCQSHVEDDSVRVPGRWPRQSELGRHHAARRFLPARPVCHHRKQTDDGGISWDRWHAAGQRHRSSPRRMAREAQGYARCRLSAHYGEVRDQDFRVRSRWIRPRTRRFDHWRPLSGARSHAGPQRAHRARVFNVGDVRKAAPFRQVRPLRGRRRHRRDVLHLQIAEGQPIAVSRRLRSRSVRRSSRPTSR